MTLDGTWVWTKWETVATTDGSTLYHTHSFTQKRNFHFRVRAQNAEGYGAWSKPLLFSVNKSPKNDLVIFLSDED